LFYVDPIEFFLINSEAYQKWYIKRPIFYLIGMRTASNVYLGSMTKQVLNDQNAPYVAQNNDNKRNMALM